jgi:penicillin-binding protein 1A
VECADLVLDQFRTSGLGKRFGRAMLAFDSFVDSSLYTSSVRARESYESFAAFMDRFHVGGWKRAVLELCCEGLTLGLGGMVLLLALALPAFQDTSDDWLKKQDLAVTFLDRYGQEVGKRGIRHDDSVPLEQYPDYLIQAVIATEDRRFYDHWGIDPIGTMRALTVDAQSSGVVQGGSSITQQLAKNLFLSNERTVERKIKEAFLALWLEFHLQKRDILQLYLDRAYMGGGTFGIQAAAEFYFGKNIRDISLAEAAMLAGLFKAPTKYAPHLNLPAARERANDVLSNLVDAGYMTEGQVYAARQNPATPVDRKRDSSPDWYLDWAYDEVKNLVDSGKFGDDRVLTVRTALDVNLQQHAEAAIEDALRESGPQWHAKQGATVVLEPNGAVRAIVGGRDYGESQFNRATEAERQPGSSFKPFVYLTALKTGNFNEHSIIDASSVCIGNWCPQNYHGESAGRIPIVEALAKSINTAAVRLSIKIGEAYWPRGEPYHLAHIAQLGRAKIVETAKAMGITTSLPDTVSLPIGADDVKVIDMASAYSVFAADGRRSLPYAVAEMRNSKGEVVYNHDRDAPPPVQIEPADKVAEMVYMMTQVVQVGTGRAAQLDGITVAGKTGTTNNSRDAWFIGYTGNYVAAVWFGNDDFSSMNGMVGGSLPAATWHDIMTYAHQGIELKPLPGLPAPQGPANVASNGTAGDLGAPQRPVTLSRKSADVLGDIEQLFRAADEKRRVGLGPVTSAVTLAAGGGVRSLGSVQ